MEKKLLTTLSGLVLTAGISGSANAALATDAVLNFNPGVVATTSTSSAQFITSGSYFAMDSDGDGEIAEYEKVALEQNDGIFIGQSQLASGSHGDVINGNESPGLDKPWEFKGNTGMHFTASPSNILTDDGAGNVTLDFSGWSVTWNGIESISMGGGAWQPDFADGIAQLSCSVDCSDGDSYTLDYSATVPADVVFGNVKYALHLEGTISSVPVPAAIWLFGSGLLGLVSVARRRRVL